MQCMRGCNEDSVACYVCACALLGKLVLFFLVAKEAAWQFLAGIFVPSQPAHMSVINFIYFSLCFLCCCRHGLQGGGGGGEVADGLGLDSGAVSGWAGVKGRGLQLRI